MLRIRTRINIQNRILITPASCIIFFVVIEFELSGSI